MLALVVQMEVMQAQNLQLVQHAHDWEAQRSAIVAQLMEMEAKVHEGTSQNAALRQENAALRNTLQVGWYSGAVKHKASPLLYCISIRGFRAFDILVEGLPVGWLCDMVC